MYERRVNFLMDAKAMGDGYYVQGLLSRLLQGNVLNAHVSLYVYFEAYVHLLLV